MIKKSNIAVIAAVVAIGFASPALARAHQKNAKLAESLHGLHDSIAAPNVPSGFKSDEPPFNGTGMGNIGH